MNGDINQKDEHRYEAAPYNPQTMLTHESIRIATEKERRLPGHALRLLLTVIGITGTVWSFKDFFDLPVRIPLIMCITAVFAVITRVLFRYPKHGLLFLLCESALIPLAIIRFNDVFTAGAENIFSKMMNVVTHQTAPALTSMARGLSPEQCTEATLTVICLILALILEFSENSRICFLLRFLVTFMFLETGLYFGLEAHPLAVLMMLVFWLGSLMLSISRKPFGQNPGHRAISKKRTFRLSVGTGHAAISAQMLYMSVLTLAAGLLVGLITRNYIRSEKMNERRGRMLDTINSFSFRDVTGLFGDLPFDFGPNIVTDEINLKSDPDLHFDGHIALEIRSDRAMVRDDYYLRGIARTTYTGSGWATRTGAYRSIKKVLKTLAEENRMPQTLWHSDHVDELRSAAGKFPVVHWQITAKQSEAVNYFSYQTLFETGTKFIYDTEADLKAKQHYDYWIVSSPRANLRADWQSVGDTESESPDEAIAEYARFVRQNYLAVPDSDAMKRIAESFADYQLPMSASLSDRLIAIRRYIWDRAEYDTEPGPIPEDADYVEYFLTSSHRGYCAHYASAGALLCRLSGIPARYVQGYVVGAGDIRNADLKTPGNSPDDIMTIEIADRRAHAWVEIYVEGYGWIPCEFTEGITSEWHASQEPVQPPQVTTEPPVQSSSTTTQTTTLSTESSTSDSSLSDSGNDPGATGMPFRIPRWLTVCVLTVLAAAAAVWLWRRLHLRIVNGRREDMTQADPNRAGDASYEFLALLLHLQGIDEENRQHSDFAALAEEHCQLLEEGALRRAVTIRQQAVFSRSGISPEQADILLETATSLAEKLYADSGRMRKFYLRWLRHIVP